MDMPQEPGAMGAMPGAGAPAADAGGGTEICLAIAPDGALSVYTKGPDGAGAESAQPAADIGAALKMVLDLYKQNAGAAGQQTEQQEFDQGFSGQGQMQSRMGARA